jgi:plastocyanin
MLGRMNGRLPLRTVAIYVACTLLSACSGGPLAPSAGVGQSAAGPLPRMTAASVFIQDFTYVPTAIRIKKGVTIVFTNRDHVDHTVTANDHTFGSPKLVLGRSWKHTFTSVGVVEYHCRIHPDMHGEVIVTK